MHPITKIFCCSTLAFGLVGCGGGGGGPLVQDYFVETPPPDTTTLESLMVASSPTKSKDFYLLPDSDDYDNIPQDPLNPLTGAKVEVGKLI